MWPERLPDLSVAAQLSGSTLAGGIKALAGIILNSSHTSSSYHMWWHDQNLNQPRKDAAGHIWHFRVWNDRIDDVPVQRIFFWDDEQRETGKLEFVGHQTLTIIRIKQRIARLVADASFRQRFHQALQFPVERHYS
jgi:hypothetical protein